MEHNIGHLRKSYEQHQLRIEDIGDPLSFFHQWMGDAQNHPGIDEANAMSLATVASGGVPHTRIVLLKAYSSAGFVFYTNYNSQKGKAIAQNAQVCLSFFWAPLERQIRINGTAIKLDEDTSTAYFNSRPKGSQLGAHASPQSEQIDSPTVLEGRLKTLQETYTNKDIPKPTHWGGYLVQPKEIEFWQGRPNRLHHRVVCRLTEHGWNMGYLAP